MRFYVLNYLTYSSNFLCILVRDFHIKLIFQFHNQFYNIERIGTQIIFKRCFKRHFRLINTKTVNDDTFYTIHYIGHPVHLLFGIILNLWANYHSQHWGHRKKQWNTIPGLQPALTIRI
ncbi:Uncharacterised protein [Mycobacterium tuberculosis]|nr:Uncharacterised protein [Mycobacterium tuberculosis]